MQYAANLRLGLRRTTLIMPKLIIHSLCMCGSCPRRLVVGPVYVLWERRHEGQTLLADSSWHLGYAQCSDGYGDSGK
jgi:hypothetical protein